MTAPARPHLWHRVRVDDIDDRKFPDVQFVLSHRGSLWYTDDDGLEETLDEIENACCAVTHRRLLYFEKGYLPTFRPGARDKIRRAMDINVGRNYANIAISEDKFFWL